MLFETSEIYKGQYWKVLIFDIGHSGSLVLALFFIFHNTVKSPVKDTLLGRHLHLADIFLHLNECIGLNILKHLLNGHSITRTQIIVKCVNFVKNDLKIIFFLKYAFISYQSILTLAG